MELFDFEGLPCVVNVQPVQDVSDGQGAIYLIMNIINGKMYVGQTWVGILNRWKGHLRDARKQYLGNAIQKYGEENFILGLLDVAETQEDLDHLETFWISTLDSANPTVGYNMTYGGGTGGKHNPQLRERHSERMKKAWADPDFRNKMEDAVAKVRDTPEYREKLSRGASAYWNSAEGKEKKAAILRDRWGDPEYREHMITIAQSEKRRAENSQRSRENWGKPEFREKMKTKMRLPERRAKISEAQKKAWSQPEYREQASKRSKDLWKNPEFRSKQLATREKLRQAKRGAGTLTTPPLL